MPGRSRSGRLWRVAVAAAVLAVALAGCRVTTTVGVRVSAGGAGAVTVTVVLDRQAAAQVGGLAGQLRTSDLVAAGWVVDGPSAGPDHTTVVAVSHPFSHVSQVPGILAEVAAPGPGNAGKTPFALSLQRRSSVSGTRITAAGRVDLRCGVSCFGDASLRKTYGSEVGVNASGFAGRAGRAAARRDFVFEFSLAVPGQVASSDAASGGAGVLRWHPALGSSVPISASAVVVARHRAAPTSGAGGAGGGAVEIVVVVVVIVGIAFVWRRLRRPKALAGGPETAD